MKRAILLVVLVVAMAAFYYRQQIYVRDFRASVTRNGTAEDGAQVFFNVNDDVLLENDNAPSYITLLEHDRPVTVPSRLSCLHFLICFVPKGSTPFADTDGSAQLLLMNSDEVQFRDDQNRTAVVSLH